MTGIDISVFERGIACGARTLGLFAMLPLGWDLLGLAQRLTLSTAVAFFMTPIVASTLALTWIDIGSEFAIGMVLGLPAAFIVECAGSAGELFDALRGQTLASSYEPLQQEVNSITAIFAKYGTWALLLGSGGAIDLVRGIVQSYETIPLGTASAAGFYAIAYKIIIYVPSLLTSTFAACLPFGFICLGIALTQAVITKQLPALALSTESFLAKTLAAALFITVALQDGVATRISAFARPIQELLTPLHR